MREWSSRARRCTSRTLRVAESWRQVCAIVRSRASSVVGVAMTTSRAKAYSSRSGRTSSAADRKDSAGRKRTTNDGDS